MLMLWLHRYMNVIQVTTVHMLMLWLHRLQVTVPPAQYATTEIYE
jgi:hypothetical protein